MRKKIKNLFTNGVSLGVSTDCIKKDYKANGVFSALKTTVILAAVTTCAKAADDEVFLPIVSLLEVWLKGNLGYIVSLFVVAAGIIYGALGGGAPVAMKAVFFGLLIGGISFIADKAFNIGLSFS